MDTETKKKYYVTAISRLTGEREVVSLKCSLMDAEQIRERMVKTRARKRSYIYPRVMVDFAKNLQINF